MQIFVYQRTQDNCITEKELLQGILKRYIADPEEPFKQGSSFLRASELSFGKGDHGKPFLIDENGTKFPGVHFSVSHTKKYWACVAAACNVGVDMEERGRQVRPAMTNRVLCEEEQKWLKERTEAQEDFIWGDAFLELWTKKEAYTKYIGTGIAEGFSGFSVFELPGRFVNLDFESLGISDLIGTLYFEGEENERKEGAEEEKLSGTRVVLVGVRESDFL